MAGSITQVLLQISPGALSNQTAQLLAAGSLTQVLLQISLTAPSNQTVQLLMAAGSITWFLLQLSLSAFSNQTSVEVTHNFGTYPIVQVILGTGDVMIPYSIIHNTVDRITVTFTISTSGSIICSLGSPQPQAITTVSNNYTALTTDRIIDVTASGVIITLPTISGIIGHEYVVDNLALGDIFVSGQVGQLIQNEVVQTIPSDCSMNIYGASLTTGWRIY